MTGARPPPIVPNGSPWQFFQAGVNVWESWIVWLADPHKAPGAGYTMPLHPGWPSAPNNALSLPSTPAIRYNALVVLQSLQTGRCSPILVVRRVETDAEVVGGDGTLSDVQCFFPEGEMAGDLVAQLQKVAFEVYNPSFGNMSHLPLESRPSGTWLCCDRESIQDRHVKQQKKYSALPNPPLRGRTSRPSSVPSTPSQRFGVLPMTPHTSSANLPSTPSSPVSTSSSVDYFGSHSRKHSSSSLIISPCNGDVPLPSTDGGPMRRPRTNSTSRSPFVRPSHKKRQSMDSAVASWESLSNAMTPSHPPTIVSHSSSNSSSYIMTPAHSSSPDIAPPRSFWTLDVGESCIWTVVSTEQKTYTFYVPPGVTSSPEPFAPIPEAIRILLPDAPAELAPTNHRAVSFTSRTNLPLVTLYVISSIMQQDLVLTNKQVRQEFHQD